MSGLGVSGIGGTVLADAPLRAALVAALVAAVLAAQRVRAGATRHAAWTIVLAAMLLMPALLRLVPAVGLPVPTAARDAVATAAAPTVAATADPRTGRNRRACSGAAPRDEARVLPWYRMQRRRVPRCPKKPSRFPATPTS